MDQIPLAESRSSTSRFERAASKAETDQDLELIEFEAAIAQYRKRNKRSFPTWSEIYEIARALGYRKIMPAKSPPRFRRSG